MSNRVFNPLTGKKEYVSRAERRAQRNKQRAAQGAPPERQVRGDSVGEGQSYLGTVENYNPETGEAIGPPHRPATSGNLKLVYLLEGFKYVWDGLGGSEGFLRWARTHETKYRELAVKLLPSQVTVQTEGLGQGVHIVHALPPPNYNPAGPLQPVHAEGRTIEVIQTVDVEAVRQAILSMSLEERAELLRGTEPQEGGNGGE
jgi:hypothetical protein